MDHSLQNRYATQPDEIDVTRTTAQPQPSSEQRSDRRPTERRSSRVTLAIPIVVYGKGPDNKMFYEEATTQVVNAHGGLLILRTAVTRQQRLVLRNPKKGEEVRCCVTYLKDTQTGPSEVGVEFDAPAPRFWGIAFPPPDWNNADRKRPQAQSKSRP